MTDGIGIEDAILNSQANQIRIEKAKDNQDYLEEDELGIPLKMPVKELPDDALGYYLAIRVILKNRKRRVNERLIYVDAQSNLIRQGYGKPFTEDKATLLKLSASSYTRPGATVYAWEYLHELLPRLDGDTVVICSGLLFNRRTGEIIETDGKELTI